MSKAKTSGADTAATPTTGTINLTADSREEIAAKFIELKAANKDALIIAGAVGRSRDNGTYSLQVDIIKQ